MERISIYTRRQIKSALEEEKERKEGKEGERGREREGGKKTSPPGSQIPEFGEDDKINKQNTQYVRWC